MSSESVFAMIRSVLLTSKTGLTPQECETEYTKMVGKEIPYKELGYNSLSELFEKSVNLCILSKGSRNETRLHAYPNNNTNHIASMVSFQKNSKRNSSSSFSSSRTPFSETGNNSRRANTVGSGRIPPYKGLPFPKVPPFKNPSESYVFKLQKYVESKGWGSVEFKNAIMGKKKIKTHISSVSIGDLNQKFQTFPQDYPSLEEAMEAVSKIAIESLMNGFVESRRTESYSIIPHERNDEDDDENIIFERVKDIVGSRTNGLWSSQISRLYFNKYNQQLSANWFKSIVPSLHGLDVKATVSKDVIISPFNGVTESLDSSSSSVSSLPHLEFPTENTWEVYIQSVKGVNSIQFRLIGDNYHEKFDELCTQMELFYFDENERCKVRCPLVGRLYAAKVECDWYRVEVRSLITKTQEAKVYFIDRGDEASVPFVSLMELNSKFLELPAQALEMILEGIAEYSHCEIATSYLQSAILGRALIAKVNFKTEQQQISRRHVISSILFDTSSDKDVNINEKINRILEDENEKKIKSFSSSSSSISLTSFFGDTNNNNTTHSTTTILVPIEKQGQKVPRKCTTFPFLSIPSLPSPGQYFDVYVILAASPSNFFVQSWTDVELLEEQQKALNSFYERKEKMIMTKEDLEQDSFFACLHSNDQTWYRIQVSSSSLDEQKNVIVKFVDYGDVSLVSLSSLQPLAPSFRALPMQAIQASLSDIVPSHGDWTPNDCLWFAQRTVDKQFVSVIRNSIIERDGTLKIGISLIDVSHPENDVIIEKTMISDDRAVALCPI